MNTAPANTVPTKTLLVMGIGNLLLTDDGVGVIAAQALMEKTWPKHIHVCEAGTFTHDIFYRFEGYADMLVLDVVHAKGTPGDLYRLSEKDLVDNEKQRLSIHDIDLLDSLGMAEQLFGSRPTLHIIGMEPHDITTWNIGLSPACEAALPKFLTLAEREIEKIVTSWS